MVAIGCCERGAVGRWVTQGAHSTITKSTLVNLRAPSLFALMFAATVPAVADDDDVWRAYTELGARTRNSTQIGHGDLFVPLWQDDSSLLFADLRGHWTDVQAAEGNWGLAYRRIVAGDWIVGAHGFYDMRHTRFNNNFQQFTLGAELLNTEWGFRANGYLPQDRVRTVQGGNVAFLRNGNIFLQRAEERAYHGFDVEAERLLWNMEPRCDEGCTGSWVSGLNAQVWAAAGVFHFDNTAAGFEDISGPRVRTELRLFDLPYLGNDSRLVFAGQYEHDHVRGAVTTGFLSVRIPLGRRNRSRRLSRLERRMVAPIVRDVDIVTNAALGSVEQVKNARTGQPITGAAVIDANTPNPEAVVAGLGPNSVVVVDGSAGTISPAGTIVMNNGQVLMGGGSSLTVQGCGTGAIADFIGPGTRPTITQASNAIDTLIITDNVTLQSIDFTGGRDGVYSNELDVANVLVQDTSVSGAADDGYDFLGFAGLFTGNRATGNGDDGIDFDGTINGTVSGNTASDNADHGFEFVDVGAAGVVVGNLATGNGDAGSGTGNGFDFFDVYGVFADNTARDNPGNDGFNFVDVKAGGRVTGNVASGNRDDGFEFGDVESGGVMSNNSATGNGDDGFEFFDVAGTFTSNTASGNGDDGFVFEDVEAGGTFSSNTASGNSGNGIDFFDVEAGGVVSGNVASGNTGDGFNFRDVAGLFLNNTANGNRNGYFFRAVASGGQVVGNTATGNDVDGFNFIVNTAGGTFSGNTANDNGDQGYEVVAPNAGTAENNVGSGNTNGNDTFP